MIIMANEYYRARNGAKVFVVGRDPYHNGQWVVSYSRGLYVVDDAGQNISSIIELKTVSRWDLMDTWCEPLFGPTKKRMLVA